MKICAAQTRPLTGDVHKNTETHIKMIRIAISQGADMIIFPELSLTGYEPKLAEELATHSNDSRFKDLQFLSDEGQITIGAGMPIRNGAGICISLLLFQPHRPRQVYSKQYLHADEVAYFVSGGPTVGIMGDNPKAALSICYELSVPEHADTAFQNGAEVYIASVAKSANGMEHAAQRLSEIARKYAMPVLVANCLGPCDDFIGAGQTAAWNEKGSLMGQLNDSDEGLLLFDTESQDVIKIATG